MATRNSEFTPSNEPLRLFSKLSWLTATRTESTDMAEPRPLHEGDILCKQGNKPKVFIGFGSIHGPKPYEYYRVR